MNRELLQRALDALNASYDAYYAKCMDIQPMDQLINDIEAELAKPDHEPIAWVYKDEFKDIENGGSCMALLIGKNYYHQSGNLIPLYLKDE